MILDLFAGPGGWDEGLRYLGVRKQPLGIENDPDAVATREAAKHLTIPADVREFSTPAAVDLEGLIASPPCQTFSQAGKGDGRRRLSDLAAAAELVLQGESCDAAASWHGLDDGDSRSPLVLEPLRIVREASPRWVVLEEVPTVLPVWQAYVTLLRASGYSAWAGVLDAADYGVPQSRKRAFLIADRERPAAPPTPTHGQFPDQQESLFGEPVKRWVTMAEALDLGEKPPPWDPRVWAWLRPATTVVRSFRPDIIAAPGYRGLGDPPRQDTPGSIQVTPEQLCVLQTVRPDYPFQGSPSKRLSLIGAMLPPQWAAAILEPLVT